MKFFPVANEVEARMISSLVYDLTRPAGSSSDTTQYSLGWEFDKNGACFLCVEEGFELPVHKNRDKAIETAIRGLQSSGKLSKVAADAMIALAKANSGKTVTAGQMIPAEWLAVAVDEIERSLPAQPGMTE